MRGTSHFAIGLATGGVISYIGDYTSIESAVIVAVAAVSSLAPDLDTNGLLTKRMTISVQIIYSLFAFLGIAIAGYSYWRGGTGQWIGIGIGVLLLILPKRLIKAKTMLILSSIGILIVGYLYMEWWIMGFAIFMGISAYSSHRGITHSMFGLLFFGWIGYELQQSLALHGVMMTAMLGYFSHLVADMRLFPFNRKGVKWFQPFITKEF